MSVEKKRSNLVIISGPSGSGKTSICNKLTKYPKVKQSISYTTRVPRDSEKDGVDYFFYSTAEFDEMIERDELLEYALVYNDYKGIPKAQVHAALASGKASYRQPRSTFSIPALLSLCRTKRREPGC